MALSKRMLIFLTLLSCMLWSQPSIAQETKSPITVTPIYPKNQNQTVRGYFDLNVTPKQHQTIKISIKNNQDKDLTLKSEVTNAYSNPSGGIMYESSYQSKDSQLLPEAFTMTQYLQVAPSITVPAKKTVELPITISVPEKAVGTLLGGVRITLEGKTQKQQQTTTQGKEAQFIIKTQNAYVIAVQLDTPTSSQPSFSLGDSEFDPEKTAVLTTMTNHAPLIQKDIRGSYQVNDSNGNVLFKGSLGPFNMAPQS
ncbi:hypothetical protein JOD43_003967 [Pullulanibacillus pueri]|uniref:WxL Interacting Protein peptidoglycan binding domain-containing protein n=1 Tax=Pullulanibacillus pueri TaxID=1437324 RepID=A0A8J2ZZQ7_9BACL|nr:DUF916 domain-containing protein [Pullulanibacillus pueri]MBM7683786.1 hypothetical protein [Pullulanibacillus pueri]GGH87254.1 hypothetical protein GCM10007096_36850 [Pullulanibacillus pueri]